MSSRSARVARGASWVYACRWLDRLIAFASIAVLARLLDDTDFGLVAIAAGYVAVIEGLSEFDVKNALIQSRSEDRALFDSGFTVSALRGLLAAVALAVAALVLEDAELSAALVVIGLAPLFEGLANPRFVMFERDLAYARIGLQTLTASILSFAVTLGIALALGSYWALIAGIVTGSLVRTLLSYALRPYCPRPTLARWREIFRFSGWMTAANIVSTLAMRTDRILVGHFLGKADAGAYYMTQRVGVLPTSELVSPLQRVLFPGFSEIRGDHDRLRPAVLESVNVLGSLALPAAVGFALTADDLVPIALGPDWLHIVPLLVVLVPFFGLRSALANARSLVLALGRTELMFRVTAAYALVHLPAFIAGIVFFGLPGAIWSVVLAGMFYFWLNAWLLRATLGIRFGEVLGQLLRPGLGALVMTGGLLALDRVIELELFAAGPDWRALTIKVLVGATTFLLVQYLLWRGAGRPPGVERRIGNLLRRRRGS